MKRLLAVLFLAVFLLPAVAFSAQADYAIGRVTQSEVIAAGRDTRYITFLCTGGINDGSIPDTDINAHNASKIQGWYLYEVEAFPTSGGIAPDAANVMVYDADGLDLLGSEDGGTTAYAGLSLIHATLKRKVIPNLYLPRAGLHVNHWPLVTGTLTLDVDAQATANANYTIRMTFVRSGQ